MSMTPDELMINELMIWTECCDALDAVGDLIIKQHHQQAKLRREIVEQVKTCIVSNYEGVLDDAVVERITSRLDADASEHDQKVKRLIGHEIRRRKYFRVRRAAISDHVAGTGS